MYPLFRLSAAVLFATAIHCASSSSNDGAYAVATGPAPPGTLACTGPENGDDRCTCEIGQARTGACSPQKLGGLGHCCATVNAGTTTQCQCMRDPARCATYISPSVPPSCTCGESVGFGTDGGYVDTCPSTFGHCCRSLTYNSCRCSTLTCSAAEVEVGECTPESATLLCNPPAIPVTLCQ